MFLGNGQVKDKLGSNSNDLKNEVISEIAAKETRVLQLSGHAGTVELGRGVSAISNNFTLTFKISKKQ